MLVVSLIPQKISILAACGSILGGSILPSFDLNEFVLGFEVTVDAASSSMAGCGIGAVGSLVSHLRSIHRLIDTLRADMLSHQRDLNASTALRALD